MMKLMDIRFDGYEPLAGGWIAPLVLFLLGGREVMREEYFDVIDPTQRKRELLSRARDADVEQTTLLLEPDDEYY